MYNFGQTKGIVDVGNNGIINAFREKSDFDGDLINIGYMVFELLSLLGLFVLSTVSVCFCLHHLCYAWRFLRWVIDFRRKDVSG